MCERNLFADRGKAPCGGEGAPTGSVVPTTARQVIGSDFSSPVRCRYAPRIAGFCGNRTLRLSLLPLCRQVPAPHKGSPW